MEAKGRGSEVHFVINASGACVSCAAACSSASCSAFPRLCHTSARIACRRLTNDVL
jgi:hypothetical protein